jgi:SOS-response transcriptional repressor LexA/DNA-binding XRE family transcriptional regulator
LEIAKELLGLRVSTGKSQAEFAKLAGVSQRTWSSYETGQTTPKMGILWALAAKGYPIKGLTSDLEEGWTEKEKEEARQRKGLVKDGAFPLDMSSDAAGEYLNQVSKFEFFKYSYGKPVPIPAQKTDPHAMVLVPLFSQRAAAGAGQAPTQLDAVETYIPLIYELLRGANPKDCGIIRVVGDSMTDMTLFNGDYVIFDRTQLEGDGVYVIGIGSDIRVKRVEYRPFEQKVIIHSENMQRYPEPEIITGEQAEKMLTIHGKVIAWFHWHPY